MRVPRRPDRNRTVRARLRAVVAVLALVAGAGTFNLAAQAVEQGAEQEAGDGPTRDELLAQGEVVYGNQCVMCHGRNARGAEGLGPSLANQGAAAIDFVIRTGRMPLSDSSARPVHGEPKLTSEQRRALVAYIPSLFPEDERGPEIPDVPTELAAYEDADLSRGLELYTRNCAACHGPTAAGIAVGRRDVSSTLDVATPLEIAEAIRIGPGVMPLFGEDVLTQEELVDVVAWVVDLRSRAAPGGAQIGRSGPVTEGLVAWAIGLGLLLVVMFLLGDRAGHTKEEITDADGNLLDPATLAPVGQSASAEGVAPSPVTENDDVEPRP